MFCDEQPNISGPSVVTQRKAKTWHIPLHVTMAKDSKLDIITYTVLDADLRQLDRLRVLGHT